MGEKYIYRKLLDYIKEIIKEKIVTFEHNNSSTPIITKNI